MNSAIDIFVFTGLLCFNVQALNCNDNPCVLGGYFTEDRGYKCLQLDAEAFCTCPNNGFEIDRPCRICNRTNPANNPCVASSALVACLETNDYGTTHACLCMSPSGPAVTASANCDVTVTLTSTKITTTNPLETIISSPCSNGGYLIDHNCHCPSGFGGLICSRKFEENLCEGIVCQNDGVCVIRNPNGPYESVCLCPYGTSGDYCQLNGTLGYCKPGLCLNSAPCQENLIGSIRHAYCDCLPGYNGVTCENQYFQCNSTGKFIDHFMYAQGKYFECNQSNGFYRLERKSCPKGLRFNTKRNTCVLSSMKH